MPVGSHELSRLDPNTFEHMANMLALRVLGAGSTGFGPGSDGGRDGYFEGTAPYPSKIDNWSGRWYIQSKFKLPATEKPSKTWLIDHIKAELKEFIDSDTRRVWPDNWIIVTNVELSGKPETGAFDQAVALVKKANPELAKRFHIWGGRKILDLLALHPEVGDYYADFVTPGQVLAQLYHQFADDRAQIRDIVRNLIVTGFIDQQFTKLEQAGSSADTAHFDTMTLGA
jgi:hypothetical protein